VHGTPCGIGILGLGRLGPEQALTIRAVQTNLRRCAWGQITPALSYAMDTVSRHKSFLLTGVFLLLSSYLTARVDPPQEDLVPVESQLKTEELVRGMVIFHRTHQLGSLKVNYSRLRRHLILLLVWSQYQSQHPPPRHTRHPTSLEKLQIHTPTPSALLPS
jgi:hypothetical protein